MTSNPSAEAFTHSYASAMHTAQSPSTATASCAEALASHYLPNMTAYTFGSAHTFHTQADATAGIKAHLERFERAGLGYDIRLVKSRVESVSEGCAVCWITWRIYPKKGRGEGWEWENLYGWRRGMDGREGWEWVVSDSEIGGIRVNAKEMFEEIMRKAAGS